MDRDTAHGLDGQLRSDQNLTTENGKMLQEDELRQMGRNMGSLFPTTDHNWDDTALKSAHAFLVRCHD